MPPKMAAGLKRPPPDSRGNSPSTKQTKLTERGGRAPADAPKGPRGHIQVRSPLDYVMSPSSVRSPTSVQSPARYQSPAAIQSPAEHSNVGSGASTPITGAPPVPGMLPSGTVPLPENRPAVQGPVTAPNQRSTSTSTSNALAVPTVRESSLQRLSPSSALAGGGNINSLRNMRAAKQNAALVLRTNPDGTAIIAAKQVNTISPSQLEAAMQKLRDDFRTELHAQQQAQGTGPDKVDKAALKALVEESDLVRKLKDEIQHLSQRIKALETLGSRPVSLTEDVKVQIWKVVKDEIRSVEQTFNHKFKASQEDADRDYKDHKRHFEDARERIDGLQTIFQQFRTKDYSDLTRRVDRIDDQERGSVKRLGDRLDFVNKRIGTIHDDVKKVKDDRLPKIETSVEKLQSEIKDIRTKAQKQSEEESTKLLKLEQRIDEGVGELDTQVSKLNDTLASNKKTYDERYATPQQVDNKISTLQSKIECRLLQATRRDTRGQREGHAENLDGDLAARVAQLEDDYKTINESVETIVTEDIPTIDERFTSIQNDWPGNAKTLRFKFFEALQGKTDPISNNIKDLSAEVKDLKTSLDDLKAAREEARPTQDPKHAEGIPGLVRATKDVTDKHEKLRADFAKLNQQINDPARLTALIRPVTEGIIQPHLIALANKTHSNVEIGFNKAYEAAKNFTAQQRTEVVQYVDQQRNTLHAYVDQEIEKAKKYVDQEKNTLYAYGEQNAVAVQHLQRRYEMINTETIAKNVTHFMQRTYPNAPDLFGSLQTTRRDIQLLMADFKKHRDECYAIAVAQAQQAGPSEHRDQPNLHANGLGGGKATRAASAPQPQTPRPAN